MMGKKIQQTREALIKILEDLRPEDHFNLISFSSEASQWKPLLVPASTQNVEEAKKYANSIQARGGTNINNAMLMAVQLLDTATREEQLPLGSVSLLLLLTDGDPTVGETNPKKIQKNVKEAIGGQYSLFCLGFGFDVSYAFLEKLALDNGGLARRIYEDSDSALQLQDFYQEVANPLLTTVSFEYPGNAVEEVTQDNFPLFFKGSEMVVAGKLRAQSPDVLSATVSGQLPTENITFQMESQVAKQEEEFQKPKYIFHGFMERLWAYLTIHQLLERMVSTSDAEKQALETQALGLSLNYSFVTPLTSMVVTKPEGQEQSQVAEKPVENGRTVFRHRAMGHKRPRLPGGVALHDGGHDVPNRKSGRSGPLIPFYEKLMSERNPDVGLLSGIVGDYLDETMEETSPTAPPPAPIQAPTFILPLPGQSVDQLCVDIKSTPGPLLLLLSDPDQGLEVTGEYKMEKAQFSWIEVTFKNPQLQVHVSPEHVVVTRDRRSSQYKWKETLFMVMPGLKMTMDKAGLLLFSSPDRVTIGLLSWDGPGQGLRLLLRDTDRFSSHVGGLLGRFYQGVAWGPPDATDDSKRTLWTRGFEFNATRKLKLDYQEGTPGTELSCWSIEL
nr:inter-alpha-trypsin inhibitor heavy chain 4 [Myotis myotis]